MKKVLLVTLFDEGNIGNRLQHYALQTVISGYGIEVTSLDNYYTPRESVKDRIKYLVKRLLCGLGSKKYVQACLDYRFLKRKKKAIRKFNENHLTTVKQITNRESFDTDWSDYDLAIAGSDQIWHKWRNDVEELPFYYLQFLPSEKRVAYAASFGFENFSSESLEQHRAGLSGMCHISCREDSGCALVKDLVGREASRVLDPTFLLNADQWYAVAKRSSRFARSQKHYAFSFFLGKLTDEYKDYMNSIMQENSIVQLINFSDETILECGPCEFLSFIERADYVFTDSFHCTAFSHIFDKEFVVFRRVQPGFEKMFGRIEDLLASVDKLDHIYGGTSHESKNNFSELYEHSVQYLENVLGVAK